MTALDRFDPFARRITEAIDEIAAERPPQYLTDILRQTARTAQRPRWTFPERWLPVDTTLARPGLARRFPARQLLILALVGLMVAATAAYFVGSQRRLPAPFGPAGNGHIVFGANGDLYVRDTLTSQPRLLLGGAGDQGGASISPDGQLVAYDNVLNGVDHVWVANVDGSSPRQVLDRPFDGLAFAWAPDSQQMAIVTGDVGTAALWIAPADGSGASQIETKPIEPMDVAWDPQRPGVLLIRGTDARNGDVDLYYVDTNGSILSQLNMTGLMLNGPRYEFSGIAFSPDGNTIAYNSVEAQEPPVNRFRVHLMDRDGTNDRAVPAPFESGYSQAWSVFSPDGKWIAMESWTTQPNGTAVNQLALAPTDGSAPARLIGPPKPGQTLIKTWSPDGSSILLCACDLQEVYAVDPVTGTADLVPGISDLPDWQRVAR